MKSIRVGKAKRAHLRPFKVGTARRSTASFDATSATSVRDGSRLSFAVHSSSAPCRLACFISGDRALGMAAYAISLRGILLPLSLGLTLTILAERNIHFYASKISALQRISVAPFEARPQRREFRSGFTSGRTDS